MIPPERRWTREEMLKRVARFAYLKGFSDGLQDSASMRRVAEFEASGR